MCTFGDIVGIHSPLTGYRKYHLCIKPPSKDEAAWFLFLNSDPGFEELYVVDCARVPFLPRSKTGKTAFSFSMIPKYNRRQLKLYEAKTLGQIDKTLARELLAHAKTITVLAASEKKYVMDALKQIAQ